MEDRAKDILGTKEVDQPLVLVRIRPRMTNEEVVLHAGPF